MAFWTLGKLLEPERKRSPEQPDPCGPGALDALGGAGEGLLRPGAQAFCPERGARPQGARPKNLSFSLLPGCVVLYLAGLDFLV